MEITYFFRPKIKGVHSIETLFENMFKALPKDVNIKRYICTHKWKRYYSFIKSAKHQGEINHITGDIHTIALFLDGSKTILTVHDIGHYERDLSGIKKLFFKILWLDLPLNKVKYITTISDFTKNKLVEQCNIPESKIIVIPNPASTDFEYSSKVFNNEKPVILQMGSGNNKNIDRLINAIAGLEFELLLIRKPDEKLKAKLKDLNINFDWYYDISRDQVYECYKKCDIVFFASEYEGFGVPILEANAVGRPVITSKISSMPFVAGDSALLVDPYNIDQIRQALLVLKNDKHLRDVLVARGLENLKRFSMEIITKQYYKLYQNILENK